MWYFSAISSLIVLNILTVLLLLYLGNISREIEKNNVTLKEKINFIKDQIDINEIEYNLFTNYNYLQKLNKIYFDNTNVNVLKNRIAFNDFKKQNIENFYTVSTR